MHRYVEVEALSKSMSLAASYGAGYLAANSHIDTAIIFTGKYHGHIYNSKLSLGEETICLVRTRRFLHELMLGYCGECAILTTISCPCPNPRPSPCPSLSPRPCPRPPESGFSTFF